MGEQLKRLQWDKVGETNMSSTRTEGREKWIGFIAAHTYNNWDTNHNGAEKMNKNVTCLWSKLNNPV